MAYGVLIIEDEATLARSIQTYLERAGFEARAAGDGESGLELFETFRPDLVLLDLRLPGIDGLEVLRRLVALDGSAKVILITAHGSIRVAVEAMRLGAYDYLSKPVVLSDLRRLIDRTIGDERTEERLSYYRRRDAARGGLDAIVGVSPAIEGLKEQLRRLLAAEAQLTAGRPAAVLITGETGTGKELIARAIHFGGPRRDGPFIELNCAALPAQLVEGELFGHERGAFTDARERRLGLVEAADGGTLFLDEIGEMDLVIQAKLLKLLEDGTVRRLGGVREHPVNLRIIAATNRSPEPLVAEGRFRSDLYFRLRIAALTAPPLREREGDVLLLARRFLDEHARRYGRPVPSLSKAAERALLAHSWPGNVRELRNVMEQAVLFCPDPVIPPDCLILTALREGGRSAGGDGPFRLPPQGLDIEELERSLVAQALDRTGWNVTAAAKLLGLTRDTLRYRIEKYRLRRSRTEAAGQRT